MWYEKETDGIRVAVRPNFSMARSEPAEGTYVFSYRVRVTNVGGDTAQLLFRYWNIHDSAGDDSVVEGEGVVGEQPTLLPDQDHEYRSFCVLRSPAGYMEGYYTFQRADGSRFRAVIPRFHLTAPLALSDRKDPADLH